MLLISETRDHGSILGKKSDELIVSLGNSNTIVYTLAFSPSRSNILDTGRGNNQNEMNSSPDLLAPLRMAREGLRKNVPKSIAEMTGGEYESFSTHKKFDLRLNDFSNHLYSRYLLSFVPKNPHSGLHRIVVRLASASNDSVLARTSYWAKARPNESELQVWKTGAHYFRSKRSANFLRATPCQVAGFCLASNMKADLPGW